MKKRIFAFTMAIVVAVSMMTGCSQQSDNNNDGQQIVKNDDEKDSQEPSEEQQEEIMPPRETSIGTSDKDINDIKIDKIQNVHNDVTGNWRYTTTSDDIDITEYALSYYKNYFKDKEIHFIINSTNKTTTQISTDGYMLFVSIYDYVDGEEHDAKLMPSGTKLKEYFIYTDNGDIEEIE